MTVYNTYWDRFRESSRYHPGNRFRYFLIENLLHQIYKNRAAPFNIVDFGCGDAELILFLKRTFFSANFLGLDVSQEQIDLNSKKLPLITFKVMDGNNPLEPEYKEKFDLVVSSEVVEHVFNDDIFIQNLVDLLKPGGLCILTTQSGPLFRMDTEILGHLRSYSKNSLVEKFELRGLIPIIYKNTGFPILSLQKRITNIFFGTIIKSLTDGNKPSMAIRLIMSIMFVCLKFFRWLPIGPQLIIVGEKSQNNN